MDNISKKYFVVLVGLPAHGKSFLAKRLDSMFNFLGLGSAIFNLGDYRRKNFDEKFESQYFNAENEAGRKQREICATMALEDAIGHLAISGNYISLYDGTNVSTDRRNFLRSKISELNFKLIWLEMAQLDEDTVERNVRKSKLMLKDYENLSDKSKALEDFLQRIEEYKKSYTPICAKEAADNKNEVFISVSSMGKEVEYRNFVESDKTMMTLKVYLDIVYSRRVNFSFGEGESPGEELSDALDIADLKSRIISANINESLNQIRISLRNEILEDANNRITLLDILTAGLRKSQVSICSRNHPVIDAMKRFLKFEDK
jgi:hypothetical protein